MNNNIENVQKPSSFISQNVWLKGIGGMILLIAFIPSHKGLLSTILGIVIVMAVITYVVKLFKMFVKSIWNS